MSEAKETSKTKSVSSATILRAALWVALFVSIVIVGLCAWLYIYAVTPGPESSDSTKVVEIPKGASVKRIAQILGENEIIYDDIRFLLLARYLKASSKLRAGEFLLETGKEPAEIIAYLIKARQVQHSVTIPEGLNVEEIASIFSDEGWGNKEAFISLARNQELAAALGFKDVKDLEGYLFPDTYFLTKGQKSERYLIEMMVERFHKIWQELELSSSGKLSRHEVVTLASIVEKETGAAHERPKIAGVFKNRLEKKMRLQSDPTVVYGIKDFNGNITKKDLKAKTPYNTYVIPALPPGPICSPGREALFAVLMPEEHKYLYFVSKNDGTHYFSKSLREHNKAVYKFQRRKKKSSN